MNFKYIHSLLKISHLCFSCHISSEYLSIHLSIYLIFSSTHLHHILTPYTPLYALSLYSNVVSSSCDEAEVKEVKGVKGVKGMKEYEEM